MSLSKAPMNSVTLLSVSAAAMAPKTSMISRGVSARRLAAKMSNRQAVRRRHGRTWGSGADQGVRPTCLRRTGAGLKRTGAGPSGTGEGLGAVAGIDLNVLFREVTRPEAGTGRASAVEGQLD